MAHEVLARLELGRDAEGVNVTVGVQTIGSSPFIVSRLASLVDLEPHRPGRELENRL